MTVEQCIIQETSPTVFAIVGRVEVACELVDAIDEGGAHPFLVVRLLEAGPSQPSGTEITVPASKVTA